MLGLWVVKHSNERNPGKSMVIMILPDRAKASSARGLADEEDSIQKALWNLKQHCDNRFVMLFNPPATSEKKSGVRRFSMGRFVITNSSLEDNDWLQNSELCLAGRPLEDAPAELPKQKELYLPESLCPDKDLRMAERNRPSPEQILAQKGVPVARSLLRSCLSNMPFDSTSSVLLVSFSGYVEDMGGAVVEYILQDPSNRDLPLNPDLLFYLSVHQDARQHEYGKMRLEQNLVQAWLDGKLKSGQKCEANPPPLTEEEIASVPGGPAAKGNLQSLKLEACVVRQSKIEILPDNIR